jgi:hypothetical protein
VVEDDFEKWSLWAPVQKENVSGKKGLRYGQWDHNAIPGAPILWEIGW